MRAWLLKRFFPEVVRRDLVKNDHIRLLSVEVETLNRRIVAFEDTLHQEGVNSWHQSESLRAEQKQVTQLRRQLKILEERQEHKAMTGDNHCSVCKGKIANGQIYVYVRTFRHQRCGPQPPRFDACGRLLP